MIPGDVQDGIVVPDDLPDDAFVDPRDSLKKAFWDPATQQLRDGVMLGFTSKADAMLRLWLCGNRWNSQKQITHERTTYTSGDVEKPSRLDGYSYVQCGFSSWQPRSLSSTP